MLEKLQTMFDELAELTEEPSVTSDRKYAQLLTNHLDLVNLFLDADGEPLEDAITAFIEEKFNLE